MKKAFYLKINRTEDFAYQNLERWLEIASMTDADCYILCDKDDIINYIRENLLLLEGVQYIKSNKSEELKNIVDNIAVEYWRNAAYAHLTTFVHAGQMGYDAFWNIDADDTQLCLSAERTLEALDKVERHAIQEGIDCFSLDIWRTKTFLHHWSFGITYTKVRKDWLEILSAHSLDNEYQQLNSAQRCNVDWFFHYLKDACQELQIMTFYIENLRFIHYSTNFMSRFTDSGFYHWKDGKLILPLMLYCAGVKELGEFTIPEEIHKIDINVQDAESTTALLHYAVDAKDYSRYMDEDYMFSERLFEKKRKPYEGKQIIFWGVKGCDQSKCERIRQYFDVKFVVDVDESQWGRELPGGIKCISPNETKNMDSLFVIITEPSVYDAKEAAKMLEHMGIREYMSLSKFVRKIF